MKLHKLIIKQNSILRPILGIRHSNYHRLKLSHYLHEVFLRDITALMSKFLLRLVIANQTIRFKTT